MRLLTQARNLRRRRAREDTGVFVAEGVRAVEELLRSPLAVRGVLVAPQLDGAQRGAALRASLATHGVEVTEVSEREFASAADTESPQGVLAIADIPARTFPVPEAGAALRIVVLDGVQDPGNVGAIVRTAAALGANATVALPGTVDLWNAKVVRSAMGAQFHHAAFSVTLDELVGWLRAHEVALWGADHRGDILARDEAPPARVALAMGNEGAGLTATTRTACARLVAIPISVAVESLNVAVATGILLYAVRS